jgi:hypothetical protein
MSLMSMASPYSSGDNNHAKKNGKRISTLRGTGSKVYPKPETEPDFTENSNILDESMVYEKNFTNDMKMSGSYFPSLDRESMENRDKVDAVPMNSFYNTTSNQQKQLSSALNKLMGGGVGSGQEGMSNFNADLNVLDSKLSGEDIANPLQKDFVKNTGILSAGSSFGHGRNGTGGGVIPTTPLDPMPMEYLRNSGYGGVKPYTDYESGYSTGVIPSHLANYSYPGMAGNLMPKEVEVTQDNNVLLEKISYMIYLLEQQKQEKKKNTTEEFVLYSFLGVFMIYVVDSFSRSGRYIR